MQLQCVVKPKSKTDCITLNPDGSLRIKIKALPVDGEANKYLIKYLADFFDLPQNCIQLISGFTGSHKRVNIVAPESTIRTALNKL